MIILCISTNIERGITMPRFFKTSTQALQERKLIINNFTNKVFDRQKIDKFTVTFSSKHTGNHLLYEFVKYKISDICSWLH
jgi:hypothetical protein